MSRTPHFHLPLPGVIRAWCKPELPPPSRCNEADRVAVAVGRRKPRRKFMNHNFKTQANPGTCPFEVAAAEIHQI